MYGSVGKPADTAKPGVHVFAPCTARKARGPFRAQSPLVRSFVLDQGREPRFENEFPPRRNNAHAPHERPFLPVEEKSESQPKNATVPAFSFCHQRVWENPQRYPPHSGRAHMRWQLSKRAPYCENFSGLARGEDVASSRLVPPENYPGNLSRATQS